VRDQAPSCLSRSRRLLFGHVSAGNQRTGPKCRPVVESLEGRLMMAADLLAMTAQQRMASVDLTRIKGLAYTPEPSDDHETTPLAYFDSDFWNNAFTPLWSSQQNIPGFQSGGKPVNGRGDLATIQSLGVNFLHLYNWNPDRDHASFLAQANADGISVTVPISNYSIGLAKAGPLHPNTFVYQLENVQNIFNEVYPNWQQGNVAPTAGITMWLITNEPELNHFTPKQVTELIQEVVYCEDQAGIPDADRLPIAIPFSYATRWEGYFNRTPGVAQVEAIDHAFKTSAPFTAAINHANPSQTVTVPALPSDFFTTRFVWAINPIGNDVDFFLGEKTNPDIYAPYNHPVDASSQIDWNAIPMVFSELGPSSGEVNTNPTIQAEILKHQLATVKWAETSGEDPAFDGAMVFQSLDQIAHKTGPESHFGIETFETGVHQTIADVPPTPILQSGIWRLDVLKPKPAFHVVKEAFA
jgi:hypothetical protein